MTEQMFLSKVINLSFCNRPGVSLVKQRNNTMKILHMLSTALWIQAETACSGLDYKTNILEKVIYNRLLEHIINNTILAKEQFGFRKNLTTEKATYELSNEITATLDKKLLVHEIFCDLAKVFDCVNHDTLLLKLNWYRITGKANNWIKSYLVDRFQRVEIKKKHKP
jgi:hypothetical protein